MAVQAGESLTPDTPDGAVKVEPKGDSILDQALAKTEVVWKGHQNSDAALGDGSSGPGKGAAAEEDTTGSEGGEEDEDLQLEAQNRRAGKPGKEKPVKLKGKTHEEEAAHRSEAERWGHELKGQVETLEGENKALKERLEALEKGGTAQANTEDPNKAVAATKENIRELLVKIDELDTFDPDYYTKKADLMAQLWGAKGAAKIGDDELQKLVAKAVKEQLQQDEANKDANTAASNLAKKAISLAKKAGLDMREKDETGEPTLDWNTFWDIAESSRAPKGIALEKQVEWVVKEVKKAKAKARQEHMRELEDAGDHHRDTAVLERYGEGRVPSGTRKAPAQMVTLQDALKRTEKRA